LQLDHRVLLFTAAATMITALTFGLAPAIQATRVDLLSALKDSRSLVTRLRSRLRGALILVQVAVSVVLLVAAVLLFRSVRNSASIEIGFDPDGVVLTSFDLQSLGYDRSVVEEFYGNLLQRARALPGVESAALADFIPMGDRGTSLAMTIPGVTPASGQDAFTLPYNRVSDGYFATIRQRVIRGREFTDRDTAGAPRVAIVNEAMARRFWPGEDVIGQQLRLAGGADEIEIVGLVSDARFASFGGEIRPIVFFPVAQFYGPLATLHLRTSGEPSAALAAVRSLVRQLDEHVAPYHSRTMREGMSPALVPLRIGQTVFAVAGVIALLLAAGGLYGLVYYTLEQRLQEIGIRIALGATRRKVFRAIVGSTLRLSAAGVAIGAVLAAVLTRALSAFLYGLSPTDPLTFGGIAALLVLVTLGAGYAGARRGLDVDPMVVLRRE
jgi:predicted permease